MEIAYDISQWTQDQKDMLQSVFVESLFLSGITYDKASCDHATGVCTVLNPSAPITITADDVLAQLATDDAARAAAALLDPPV